MAHPASGYGTHSTVSNTLDALGRRRSDERKKVRIPRHHGSAWCNSCRVFPMAHMLDAQPRDMARCKGERYAALSSNLRLASQCTVPRHPRILRQPSSSLPVTERAASNVHRLIIVSLDESALIVWRVYLTTVDVRACVARLVVRMVEAALERLGGLVRVRLHPRENLIGSLAVFEEYQLGRPAEVLMGDEAFVDPLSVVLSRTLVRVAPVNTILHELLVLGKCGLTSLLPYLCVCGAVYHRAAEGIPELVGCLKRLDDARY